MLQAGLFSRTNIQPPCAPSEMSKVKETIRGKKSIPMYFEKKIAKLITIRNLKLVIKVAKKLQQCVDMI